MENRNLSLRSVLRKQLENLSKDPDLLSAEWLSHNQAPSQSSHLSVKQLLGIIVLLVALLILSAFMLGGRRGLMAGHPHFHTRCAFL